MSGPPDRLFGTDGIRGLADQGPLAPANAVRLGRAIARATRARVQEVAALRVLCGRDPRPSGPRIEADLAAGLAAGGARVESAGVIPTPGVSYLVRRDHYALGIVISASHNPPEYNGVKLFEADGTKSSDELEAAVEAAYAELPTEPLVAREPVRVNAALAGAYASALAALDPERALGRLRVVLDCASGATGAVARSVFNLLETEPHLLNSDMDGARINDGSGALHPEVAAAAVLERGAFAGFSFDGDGDRVIAIDERGAIHDGDDILCALALFLECRGELTGRAVVATVLSNMGLEVALEAAGIALERVPVGDRHVSSRLLADGLALGGEQSGHIVLPRAVGPTGDGIACAVELLRAAAALGRPLSELLAGFHRYPQEALSVRVSSKPPLDSIPAIRDAIACAERALAGCGRIIVRYSGTEPLARVMVEAREAALTARTAADVARAIELEIGARE